MLRIFYRVNFYFLVPNLALILTFYSCSRPLTPAAYSQWVKDESNGLNTKQIIGDVQYQLQYTPIPFLILSEYAGKGLKDKTYIQEVEERAGFDYFVLSLSSVSKSQKDILKLDLKEENQYYDRLNYFISHMQRDIVLSYDQDTVPCALFHYERTYGLTPYQTFVLGFQKGSLAKEQHDITFVFHDRVFNDSTIIFKFTREILNEIPELKLK